MTQVSLFVLLLAFIRISTFLVFVPIFSRGRLPGMVKIGLAVTLTWLWSHDLPISELEGQLTSDGNMPLPFLAIAIASEVIFGAAIGYFFSIFVEPIRIAGAYIGQEMGLNLAAIADPTNGTSTNVVATILESLVVLMVLQLNLHHYLFGLLFISFRQWPVGVSIAPFPLQWLIGHLSSMHEYGLLTAAPIGIVLFLTTLLLGIFTKVSTHLNFFAIGFSVRGIVGLSCLVLCLPSTLASVLRFIHLALDAAV